MTPLMIGFGAALATALAFASFIIPRRYVTMTSSEFSLSMSFGILASCLLVGILLAGNLRLRIYYIGLAYLSGAIWASATVAFSYGVQYIGLARSSLYKNLTALFGTLFGIVIFREITVAEPLTMTEAVAGSAAVVASALAFTYARAGSGGTRAVAGPGNGGSPLLGIVLSLYAAVGYALYMVPAKVLLADGVDAGGLAFYLGQGECLATLVLSFITGVRASSWRIRPVRDHMLAVAGGASWTIGLVLALVSTHYIGLAISWPITQLSSVITALWGVFVFKEIDFRSSRNFVVGGSLLSLIGIGLLAVAKL